MKSGLSEVDLTLQDIQKDENPTDERSAEDEQAIAEAVEEVEKELGTAAKGEPGSQLLQAFVGTVMIALTIAWLKR